jgi:RNA polymerase sigma factor (sigma-70 family)
MTGSVIDGEDVLQEALLKAVEASPQMPLPTNPDGWLFRVAHNAAIDYLRRRARHVATHAEEDLDMIAAPTDAVHDRQIAAASLHTFMRLPVRQRSAVILRDVLGYSVEEICDITSAGILAVRRHISFFLNGLTSTLRLFAISCSRATPSKAPTLSPWADKAPVRRHLARPLCSTPFILW